MEFCRKMPFPYYLCASLDSEDIALSVGDHCYVACLRTTVLYINEKFMSLVKPTAMGDVDLCDDDSREFDKTQSA